MFTTEIMRTDLSRPVRPSGKQKDLALEGPRFSRFRALAGSPFSSTAVVVYGHDGLVTAPSQLRKH